MEKQKKSEKGMERYNVINSLRAYAHHSWFHRLLSWPTSDLKCLLAFYQRKTQKIGA